jgi:hypothetical protein
LFSLIIVFVPLNSETAKVTLSPGFNALNSKGSCALNTSAAPLLPVAPTVPLCVCTVIVPFCSSTLATVLGVVEVAKRWAEHFEEAESCDRPESYATMLAGDDGAK